MPPGSDAGQAGATDLIADVDIEVDVHGAARGAGELDGFVHHVGRSVATTTCRAGPP